MNRGICALSNIPLRKEANSKSEIVSMLLFGETYTIYDEQDDWTLIKTELDNYDGWISSKQKTELFHTPQSFHTVTQFPFQLLNNSEGSVMAPLGSSLPDFDGLNCKINQTVYAVQQESRQTPQAITEIAHQFINAPYLWGGRTAFGIDCSGFTQVVFKCLGIQLKRDAYQQAEMGNAISFLAEAQMGDLAFFDNNDGHITHVGILLDNHRIIHASGKVRIDSIDSYGILNNESKSYSHKLRIIKRLL